MSDNREAGELFKQLQDLKIQYDITSRKLETMKNSYITAHAIILKLIDVGIRKYSQENADELMKKYLANGLADEIDAMDIYNITIKGQV